jgi:hypothetical protein
MKTRIITTVLISMMMFASVNVFGGKPLRTMSFYSFKGIVEIPVKVEEAPDSLPVVVKVAILRNQVETRCHAVTTQFDLSQITKPEPDTDDVAINTRHIFEELRYREFARK